MNCKEAFQYMHEYLDGDLQQEDVVKLKAHLTACESCAHYFQQLEHTEAIIRVQKAPAVPIDLKDRIMQRIPEKKTQRAWLLWLKRRPALSVAVLFVVVMFGSYLAQWNSDHELVVQGADLSQVIIQGHTVFVPRSHTVKGNLTVKNGKIQVDGSVKGNVVVIDGSVDLASTAHISGKVTMVNQVLDWLWYKTKMWFGREGK